MLAFALSWGFQLQVGKDFGVEPGWAGLGKGRIWGMEGLQWDTMPQSARFTAAICSEGSDLCCLEIGCNSVNSPGAPWRLATWLLPEEAPRGKGSQQSQVVAKGPD